MCLLNFFKTMGMKKQLVFSLSFFMDVILCTGHCQAETEKCILAFILLKCLSKETAWLSLAHVKC